MVGLSLKLESPRHFRSTRMTSANVQETSNAECRSLTRFRPRETFSKHARPIRQVLLFATVLFASACKFGGDGIANLLDAPVLVTVERFSGEKETFEVSAGTAIRENAGAKNRYKRMEVFSKSGKKLGEITREQVFNRAGSTSGKYISLIVVDEGIFPIPRRYSGPVEQLRRNKGAIIEAYRFDKH